MVIPKYVPYIVGEKYAQAHVDWMLEHSTGTHNRVLEHGMNIGKQHTLLFTSSATDTVKSRVQNGKITVQMPLHLHQTDTQVQLSAFKAATRAIKREAEVYLPARLYEIARQHGYKYKSVSVKNMHTRWGSCSSERVIALNIWLMQVPEELIQYVLCHELAHLHNPHHKQTFWSELETLDPSYKAHRMQLKSYHPNLA